MEIDLNRNEHIIFVRTYGSGTKMHILDQSRVQVGTRKQDGMQNYDLTKC